MSTSALKPGILVALQDLDSSSALFKQGASLRVTGNHVSRFGEVVFTLEMVKLWLQEYSVETAVAVIVDGSAHLKIDTKNLREIHFCTGSIYQFIGELLIQPENNAILQARVGRNVDGIDLNLYYQSLQLRRKFEADHMNTASY